MYDQENHVGVKGKRFGTPTVKFELVLQDDLLRYELIYMDLESYKNFKKKEILILKF